MKKPISRNLAVISSKFKTPFFKKAALTQDWFSPPRDTFLLLMGNGTSILISLTLYLPSCLPNFCASFFLSFFFFRELRSVSERQDAVQEILESDSLTLNSTRSLLSHLPDLERGICSIYHKKVKSNETGRRMAHETDIVASNHTHTSGWK